ncbi:cytoplasmic protein [Hysterangium stoloniferum]|nr:cytoplasmic protein [Hysterangium stoloniferum]
MDIYSTSFSFPSPHSHLDFSNNQHRDPYAPFAPPPQDNYGSGDVTADAVQKVTMAAMQAHGCLVSYTRAERGRGWNFYLSGNYQQVLLARGTIIKDCPVNARVAIKVTRSDILNAPATSPSLKPDVRRRLDEIASQTHAHIAVVNTASPSASLPFPDPINGSGGGFAGLDMERMCELVITGSVDAVEVARLRLLVMLDELAGLHAEAVEIDHKLHPIIAAQKRGNIQTMQEETATNIYLPTPFQGLVGPACPPMDAAVTGGTPRLNCNIVWITGEFFGTQRARDMLVQTSLTQAKKVISREAPLHPRKLDWMLTERIDDLKMIMRDNGTYINCPAVGGQTTMIIVYGDSRIHIQRTIRSIMQLACQFYVATIWLLPIQYNVLMPSTINPAQMPAVLKRISGMSGAEVVFKGNCFELYGMNQEVRTGIGMVLDLEMVKNFHHEVKVQTELANEHREFISGKKNGKINKIMQMTGVKIKFETLNEHNFIIDLIGSDGVALHGLTMLQEELPAEISFHVPEAYHKRIIGVGGRSIQRIMKKYGVYVKFSNAEEFAALGGYADNEDNVVARTPAKNAMNLENLKQSVLELVNPKDKDYIHETVLIPRKYHRTLLGEKNIFIHDIEQKTNSKIQFPDKETASDIVDVYGPENQVHIAATMLLDHVPFEADMPVPPNADLARIITSAEFLAFTERIKGEFEVDVTPTTAPSENGNGSPSNETFFRLRCQRSNADSVATAKEMLEAFLVQNGVQIYQAQGGGGQHRRSDSFADAFPHFNSKLLSTSTVPDSPDFGRNADLVGSPDHRRIRLATSTPDVKALFHNSPQYVYKLPEHEEQDEVRAGYGGEYWPSLGPPPMRTGHGVPVHRSRHREDPVKRGSDSLLEAKIKEQISKPRSLTNRAQSLDLTFSFSRISDQTSRLPPPPSPTGSTTDTGATSSPTSGSAPSFPSVYGPPSSLNPVIGAHRHSQPPAEISSTDEVTRVINNLRL